MRSILPQAEIFFQDSVNISITKIEETNSSYFNLALKDYSSMMQISSNYIDIKVVISFDTALIDQIVKNFIGVKDIKENEKEALYLDGSGEVMNILFGLASPGYIKKGENFKMYPPISISSIEEIIIPKQYSVLHESICTDFGNMGVAIMESKNDYHLKKKTVLVVDDSLMIRTKMTSLLKELGHETITAKNGNEAIDLYQTKNPDLITMDITMPGMDGITTLKHLIEIDKDVKVIIYTSKNQEEVSFEAFKEGALDYLLKPASKDKLKNVLDRLFPNVHT